MRTDWILLVNDIPDHSRVYEAALRARGYNVRLTTTATDALAVLQGTSPTCCVIDERLPDLSGWELCRRMKSDKRMSTVPVVMLAANISRQHLQSSRIAGCAAWLMRPGTPDDVVRAVEHVVEQGVGHPELHNAIIGARECPACASDDVRAGVRVGAAQYFFCKACLVRWRIDAQGVATA